MERLGTLDRVRGLKSRIGLPYRPQPTEVPATGGITGVITQVDEVLDRVGGPRMPGYREGICGIAADLVKRAAELRGMKAYTVQNRRVHSRFGRDRVRSFLHGFNLVRDGEASYLVDESFCQFIDARTQQIRAGEVVSGSLQDHPIALELLEKGYVELTDESVKAYLRASASGEKGYIDSITAQDVLENSSFTLPYIEDVRELDKYLSGKAIPQDEY